jgi:Methyltransferase domain
MTKYAQKAPASDAAAVARAHAVYTPLSLFFYDLLVHRFSNHFAWQCPTGCLQALYGTNLSSNHLEAGVGTGYFLDHMKDAQFDRLVLLDINRHCLDRAAGRLARFNPAIVQASLLAPIAPTLPPFDSIGLTYVLHCFPGRMDKKLAVIDHLRPLMNRNAVLFGATILGRGITPNVAARRLLALYNAKGVFDNYEDDLESLTAGLRQRFARVEIERQGCVALFSAT